MDTTKIRTWAEISLGNLEHNYKLLRARVDDGTRFLGVIKADAFSHGAPEIARRLVTLGADMLAVACLSEAVILRDSGIDAPILIFGATPPEYAPLLVQHGITQTVEDYDTALALSEYCAANGVTLTVHLKVDTGMNRLGYKAPYTRLAESAVLPGLNVEGIYTHFAVADEPESDFTQAQFDAFLALVSEIEKKSGHKFKIKHCANSGAVINCKEAYLDMIRPGIALYGGYTDPVNGDAGLRPVMSLKTRIVQIKDVQAGDTVSYGRTYTAEKAGRIAVLGIGYADGLHRMLSGKAEFLLHGTRIRQVGRICMDLCMADVTDAPQAKVGDVVTIFGTDGESCIPACEQAELAGTISYELMCAVSKRVPRVYI